MNTAKPLLLIAITLLFLSADSFGQRRRTPAKPKPMPTTSAAIQSSTELRAGADKVSVQLKNVTKFLYTLGGIAVRIEDLDIEARSRPISRAAAETNEENKQKVMQAIRNLRAGISALEVEFRAKPVLGKYLLQMQGITDLSAQCEDLAAAGRYSEAGKPLLLLVERLSDTLAAMP